MRAASCATSSRGAELARGQRYGFIRFGSRVDLYLPLDARAAGGDRRQGLRVGDHPGDAWRIVAEPDAQALRAPEAAAPAELRRRSIYLLPNLLTTAALFAGFYAIVQAMNARFEQAAVAIFIAMVLDGLDGRVARMTRTQSEFGADYDSLSDMVSFGAAPALVMYVWALKDLGTTGWIAAFVYCAGAAVRLARFNTNIDGGRQALLPGPAQPGGCRAGRGFHLGCRRFRDRSRGLAALHRVLPDAVCRRHHGGAASLSTASRTST